MSEHVLCMVLYLIELGLDNQVQDNKGGEVRYHGWELQPVLSLNNAAVTQQQHCTKFVCHVSRSLALRSTATTAGFLAPTSSPICTMSSTL